MRKMDKISYLEWKIVLLCAGIEKVYGLETQEEQEDERELLFALHRLVKNGRIFLKKDGFLLEENMKRYAEIWGQATQIWYVESVYEDGLKQGIYYGGAQEGIWMTPCLVESGKYEISMMKKEQWIRGLQEEGYVPYRKKKAGVNPWNETDVIPDEETIFFWLREISPQDGQTRWTCMVGETAGREWLYHRSREGNFKTAYETEKWINVLNGGFGQ